MWKRFEGENGKKALIQAVKANKLFEHDEALAIAFIEVGERLEFNAEQVLIEQNGTDNDLYLIVAGTVDIIVNGRKVAERGPEEPIGDMALIDPKSVRSATVTARENVAVLKITEPNFRKIVDQYDCRLWRPLALIASDRLRQRNRFHLPPNDKPRVFIASSNESRDVAQAIYDHLSIKDINPETWRDGIFGPSSITINALEGKVRESDFAVFVFGPDDEIVFREEKYYAPRDNVVFELGLFMGLLGLSRTFIFEDRSTRVKIPTDLGGVNLLRYNKSDNLSDAVKTQCETVIKSVLKQGVR